MGQFSWLDCITEEQIIDGKPRKSYVLIPAEYGGGHIEEPCYEGYGVFGGYDIYDLVVDWNMPYIDAVWSNADTWKCEYLEEYRQDYELLANGQEPNCEKRTLGIGLACYDEDNVRLRYPIKITHDPNAVYEWCAPSKSDPNQGWPANDYDDWDEWDDEYDDEYYDEYYE